MKKLFFAFGIVAIFAEAAFAENVKPQSDYAWFDIKLHSAIGYNFETDTFGIESSIDEVQIWWGVFNGLPQYKDSIGDLDIYLKIENLSYAFKFNNSKTNYKDYYSDRDANLENGYGEGTKKDQTSGWEETPGGANDAATNYFSYDKIMAGIKFRNYLIEFYNFDYYNASRIGFSHASMRSLFDDFRDLRHYDGDGDNKLGFLYFNGLKDTYNILEDDQGQFGITGAITLGVEFDKIKAYASVGATGSWLPNNSPDWNDGDGYTDTANIKAGNRWQKENFANAGVVQLDLWANPVNSLEINFSALSTFNFTKAWEETNVKGRDLTIEWANLYGYEPEKNQPISSPKDIQAAGINVQYTFDTDYGALIPYVGFDMNYAKGRKYFVREGAGILFSTKNDEVQFEAGAGLSWHPRGIGGKAAQFMIDEGGHTFPVGASLGLNCDQHGIANLVLSWFEGTDEQAFLPNLGYFLQFEWVNFLQQDNQDSRFYLAAEVEYMFKFYTEYGTEVGLKPYILGRCIQRCSSDGLRTDAYNLDTRIGVAVYPSSKFSVDLRYERGDILRSNGKKNDVDKGCISATFRYLFM